MLRALLRDPIVLAGLAVLTMLGVAYAVPGVSLETRVAVGDRIELGPLVCLIIGCFYGLRQIEYRAERRFWILLGLAFVALVFSPLAQAIVPDSRWSLVWDAVTDATNLTYYVFLLLAIELRPHHARTGSLTERERHLRSAGLTLLGFFGLSYFIVVFAVYDFDSYRSSLPSIGLYVALDLVVLLRLALMRRQTWSVRWTALYAWLALACTATTLTDVAEGLWHLDAIKSGGPLDLLWALPPVLFLVAVRARHAPFSAEHCVLNEETVSYHSWRAGHLLMLSAFALPIAHYVFRAMGVANVDRLLPEFAALGSMVTLGALALVAYRVLERDRDRIEEKERKLMTELGVARKMDAVARLAGSVAHDFNSLIQVVRGRAEIMAQQVDPSDPVTDDIREIRAAATRAAALASQLMTFGRKQPAALATVSLHEVIVRTEPLITPLLKGRVKLQLRLKAFSDVVRLDPMQFERVLLNLATNARDAMPNGGTLLIATSNPTHDALDGPYVDHARVVLTVTDTGTGMDSETISHIFEPFFTTKEKQGAGLGLAIVHSLVQQCSGSISVQSDLGVGTTFTISLSALHDVTASPIPGRDDDAFEISPGAVLIVDGEATNRQLLRRLLADLERPILATATTAEAIQIAQRYGAPIDVAVIDISIEDGRLLADQLRESRPSLRALLLAQDQPLEHAPHDALLREPFEMSDVLGAARKLIA